MSRKTARENTFRLIYEFCVNKEKNEFTEQLLCNNSDEDDANYIKSIYEIATSNYEYLKTLITRYSSTFSFDRIYKVDLAIILTAMSEILFREDIPFKVSINEALDLAKVYSAEKSVVFINGILASVIRNKEDILNERNAD